MKISQKMGVLGGSITAEIDDNDSLVITQKRLLNKYEHKYLLDDIDSRWQRVRHFSLLNAAVSIASLIGALLLVWYGKAYHEPPDDGIYMFLAFVLGIFSLVTGIKAFRSRVNIVSFNHKGGGRLFSLFGNKPSADDVERFCQTLASRIERIRYHGEISRERMATILEKHVEFLRDHGVLTDQEVDSARKRIRAKGNAPVVKLVATETQD